MTETEKTPAKKKKGLSAQAIVSIIIICLLIVVPTAIYLWKQAEINKLKKQQETQINAFRADAKAKIDNCNKNNIETLTRVFSWAVRSEMLRNNIDQVNTYMTTLVKAADLNDISVIKSDGMVVLSTNKKYEGNAYAGPVASQLSTINDVVSQNGQDNNIIVISPIMGLDTRLGSIVITYTPKTYVFGNTE
ncbi:MAG: hypothetical protein WCQ95_02380 [Bacteroidota bacterium]